MSSEKEQAERISAFAKDLMRVDEMARNTLAGIEAKREEGIALTLDEENGYKSIDKLVEKLKELFDTLYEVNGLEPVDFKLREHEKLARLVENALGSDSAKKRVSRQLSELRAMAGLSSDKVSREVVEFLDKHKEIVEDLQENPAQRILRQRMEGREGAAEGEDKKKPSGGFGALGGGGGA